MVTTDPSPRLEAVLAGQTEFAVFFSAQDDLLRAITTVIGHAKGEIFVQAWALTCRTILDALLTARAQTIDIAISDEKTVSAGLRELAGSRAGRIFSDPHRKNHNKTIIADHLFVLNGSVNFLYDSDRHDKSLIVTSRDEGA